MHRNIVFGGDKMKKILFAALALFLAFGASSCKRKDAAVKIGIAKISQHPALDDIERGVQDAINNAGIKATYDLQNANGDVNTAAQIASQFKSEKVAVAVGIATPVAVALANTIKDTPIVFGTVTDPVGAGLVEDVSRGYKNVTGTSDAVPSEQQIKLFAQVAGIKTLGYIYTSNEANSVSSLELVKKGCDEAGLELATQAISNSSEVQQAAQAIVDRVDGIYLTTDNTVFSALPTLVQVFNKAKKPIFSADVTGAKEGGIFMAQGFNYYKFGLATGEMVVKILNGAKPADLPVRFMTEAGDNDLLFDLDAAAACGIEIPSDMLESANFIFEGGALKEK